jgi:hypothetical protein
MPCKGQIQRGQSESCCNSSQEDCVIKDKVEDLGMERRKVYIIRTRNMLANKYFLKE